ncbi:MAG TPA: hypothetical protein VGD78_09405 [Chthoniobacterales bacterium]
MKAVAKKLGIPLSETAKANEIVEEISSKKSKWAPLDTGKEAAQQAHCGNLVLAGLKATDYKPGCLSEHDGHVVVVADGELYHQKYSKCWRGSTKGPVAQSKGEKSVGQVWNRLDRDRVVYYAFSLICRI